MSVVSVVAEVKEAIELIQAFKDLRTEVQTALGLDPSDSVIDAIKEIRAAIRGETSTATVGQTAAAV